MALRKSYAGIPTPLLALAAAGTALYLVARSSTSEAAQLPSQGPPPLPPRPGPPPFGGIEIGPAVIEPRPPPTVGPAYVPPYKKLGIPFTFMPGKFYRARIDLPVATLVPLTGANDQKVRDLLRGLGLGGAILFNDPRQLDPTWPPDALAGGATLLTYWAQNYWPAAPTPVLVKPDWLTNIWEY